MTTLHLLSILLPFANETAIVLTHSKLPFFKDLYRDCIDEVLEIKTDKICKSQDYLNKIIIDLVAYIGIILFICKNAINYGYTTGIVTGIILIFLSIIIPNMFLGISIDKITTYLTIKNPYLYILVGILMIAALVLVTSVLESIAQNLIKEKFTI